jgi:hypothetical protein
MFIKFLMNCGSYRKDQSYDVPNRLAKVLVHARKAQPDVVPAMTGTPEQDAPAAPAKRIAATPLNRMMTAVTPKPKATPAKKPATPRPSRAKKNEYETKKLPANK